MKLKLFLIAASAMALASCSSDEVVKNNEDANAIKFSVVANNASRASDYYCNNNLPADFDVWASVKEDASSELKSYFAGENYKKDGSSTVYIPTDGNYRYWPKGTVNFYAVKNGTITWTDIANPEISFAPKATSDAQKDLIYAYAQGTKPATYGTAQAINFRHALSQIVFYAQNLNKKIYVEISKVAVCNVAKSGVFTLPIGTNVTAENMEDHGQATVRVENGLGKWTNVDYADYETSAVYSNTLTVAADRVNLTDNSKNSEGKEINYTNSLLVLPQVTNDDYTSQATTAWNPKGGKAASNTEQTGTYFAVTCKIWNVAATVGDSEGAVNKGTDVVLYEGVINIPASFAWQQGKKYIYTFKFTTDGHGGYEDGGKEVLIPIKFDVEVDDFGKVDNADVTIDPVTPAP